MSSLSFFEQKHSLDVGQNTSLGDGDTGQKLVQFLVLSDGQLKMKGMILVFLLSQAALLAT